MTEPVRITDDEKNYFSIGDIISLEPSESHLMRGQWRVTRVYSMRVEMEPILSDGSVDSTRLRMVVNGDL